MCGTEGVSEVEARGRGTKRQGILRGKRRFFGFDHGAKGIRIPG
jgi:hypothetical protein